MVAVTAVATASGTTWSIYEKETPVAAWAKLSALDAESEKWAFESVKSRCMSSAGSAFNPKAQLKIVSPTGAETVYVCSEVRAANGMPENTVVIKDGKIISW